MKRYQWILFDADETLFNFDAKKGLTLMFQKFGQKLTDGEFENYQKLNHSLWKEYQDGRVTAADIKVRRFSAWQDRLGRPPAQINSDFLTSMSEICELTPHAGAAVTYVSRFAKLGLITNGFREWQLIRLERTGLIDKFDIVVTSEDAGVAKPNRRIFDYALGLMGAVPPSEVLMVGDNLHSDILGGVNAGFDTCWISNGIKPDHLPAEPTFTVHSMREFQTLVQDHYQE